MTLRQVIQDVPPVPGLRQMLRPGNCPVDPHQADDFIHDIGSLNKDTWDSEKVLIIQSFHLRHCYQVTGGEQRPLLYAMHLETFRKQESVLLFMTLSSVL